MKEKGLQGRGGMSGPRVSVGKRQGHEVWMNRRGSGSFCGDEVWGWNQAFRWQPLWYSVLCGWVLGRIPARSSTYFMVSASALPVTRSP